MRNTTLFAFAPALIAIGFGVWAASPANAPASPSMVQGIEPLQIMVNAKELPTVEFADYTFVFAHQGLVRNGWSHTVTTRFAEVARCAQPRPATSPRGSLTNCIRLKDANWPGEVLQHRSRVWLHRA